MPEGYEISKEEAEKIVINFGKKHPGETLGEIAKTDKNYLMWLVSQESTKQSLKEAISKVIYIPDEEEQTNRLILLDKVNNLIIEKDIDLDAIKKKFKVESTADIDTKTLKELVVYLEGK